VQQIGSNITESVAVDDDTPDNADLDGFFDQVRNPYTVPRCEATEDVDGGKPIHKISVSLSLYVVRASQNRNATFHPLSSHRLQQQQHITTETNMNRPKCTHMLSRIGRDSSEAPA